MDAFNLSGLRKSTPKYLGMDSLMEALPPDETEQDVCMQDVSMQDVSMADLSDDPGEPEPAAPVESTHSLLAPAESGTGSAAEKESAEPSAPAGPVASAADVADEHAGSPEKIPIRHDDHIFKSDDRPYGLRAVMAPTQAGAHQAVNRDFDALNMPIPPPWHANPQYTLSTYLQLAFNVVIVSVVGWFLLMVKNDVGKKIAERQAKLVRDASWCQEQYLVNQCGSGRAAPHLVENRKCLELEHCMDADPEHIRWLSMSAALLAEVMNEFVLPLQLRTIASLLCLALVGGLVVGANYWFGFWRARTFWHDARREPDSRMMITQ